MLASCISITRLYFLLLYALQDSASTTAQNLILDTIPPIHFRQKNLPLTLIELDTYRNGVRGATITCGIS
jgi:hypothetical protein